jgi:hypothetical protein
MSTITTKEKDDQINQMEIRIEELEARQINYDRILVLAARWCDVKHDDWKEILSIATGER